VVAITSDEHERSAYLAAAPPLSWMAGFGALADMVINRLLVPLGSEAWSAATLVELSRWGAFARNLSVVSALVALSFCLVSLSSPRAGVSFSGRAAISSFGWVLVPIIALMTFLPRALTRVELVLVVAGLTNALVLLLVLAGVQWRTTRPVAVALILTMIAALSGMLSMIVSAVGGRAYWEQTDRLSNAFRWSGELAYLAVPIVIGLAISIPWREARGKAAIVFSALAAATVATSMVLSNRATGFELPELVYGAMRLDFLPDDDFILYAIPLGAGAAVTMAAILSRDPIRRQIGAALLLFLSAGYAPRTPSALLISVLGVTLLARAGIALGQRTR
jgi:hypothetical protein